MPDVDLKPQAAIANGTRRYRPYALSRVMRNSCAVARAAVKSGMVASVIIGFNASGWSEDDAGKAEYLSSCAPCHGSDGKGKGPLSSKLKKKPADLTTFAKKNNGVFPLSAVYEAIDGRNAIASHGSREMPVWGCRHSPSPISPTKTSKRKVYKQLGTYESHLDLSCDPEDVIANRILSVVEYLRRIQEK
jgi:mono/diheme cytochrome c family protein